MTDPISAPVLEESVSPTPTPDQAPAGDPATPTPNPVAPVAGDGTPAPAAPEPELYELPDGRKVDAATLSREWKENFLPEFTRKSQALAERGAHAPGAKEVTPDQPPWMKDDWQPGSYAEIVKLAKEAAITELRQGAEQEAAQARAVAEEVDKQITDLKAKDPQLDENALFNHALKYGFRDLNAAHSNMIAFRDVARETEERVTKGQTRKDPIAAGGGTPPSSGGALEPGAHSNFRSANEFLRSLKN